MTVRFSDFAQTLSTETAFTVLAVARQLQAQGKDVVELEIGDSPFESTPGAKRAGIEAIRANKTHYCPSLGLPEFRQGIARFLEREWKLPATADHVVVGPGAKVFEQFFCEAFLDPGDGVLVFSPFFPTYVPNIARRSARPVLVPLRETNAFRPDLADVETFLKTDPKPKAIFLNSPHNPTGGVATEEDLKGLADLVRGRNVAVFSDEPYCHMVWKGKHRSLLEQPGMFEQTVAAYTFSKSYSMSGWRLGFAVGSPAVIDALGKMINTSLSCVPPLVQLAGLAALENDDVPRDESMRKFADKVRRLTDGLNRIDGIRALEPAGTFYVFPNVTAVCNRLGLTSHGLAMYLLEGADPQFGIACLGGECFGEAGAGFLRFSCAEPDERIEQALRFLPDAFGRSERVARFLETRPEFRLKSAYRE